MDNQSGEEGPGRGQFNAHPHFQNEESTEKEGMWKIQKYDKKKSRENETSQKVERTESCV